LKRPYGDSFEIGDSIKAFIDLQDEFSVSFSKNGKYCGLAESIPEQYRKSAFFPHVCIRNASAEFNFGKYESKG